MENIVDITEEAEQLLETMNQIFSRNMKFLSTNSPKYHKQILEFSSNIDSGKSEEKLSVELNKEHFIDILNRENNTFFFNSDPFEYGELKVKSLKFRKADKIVFEGVLLGTQIEPALKKYKPKSIFIMEESLEIFRVFLNVIDLETISKNTKMYLCIGKPYNSNEAKYLLHEFQEYMPELKKFKTISVP